MVDSVATVPTGNNSVQNAPKRRHEDENAEKLVDVHFGRVLGEGAFGLVKLCVLPNRRKPLAVKCMDLDDHVDMLPTFKKEAQMHKSCSQNGGHPNILHCYGFQIDISIREFQIFLEFADGGELFDKIEPEIGMPISSAQSYFLQLLDGIEFMHGRGMAHRDIKPENLLLTGDYILKISDFGMATLFRHNGVERLMTSYCGTLPYIAPEVMLKMPYKAEPSDVWSCGMVLVTLLLGELPWQMPCVEDPIYAGWISGTTKHKAPWNRLDTKALSLLLTILKEDPTARPTIAKIKAHPWCTSNFGAAVGVRSAKKMHPMHVNQDEFDAASQPAYRHKAAKIAKIDGSKSFSQPENLDLLSDSQVSDHSQKMEPFEWIVRRMTRFCVVLPVSQLHSRLSAVCEECGFALTQKGGNQLMVTYRDTSFFIIIMEMTQNGNKRVMLDFRRSRGDGLEFKKAFILMRDRMKDVFCADNDEWLASQGFTQLSLE